MRSDDHKSLKCPAKQTQTGHVISLLARTGKFSMNPLQPLFVNIHLLRFGKFILLQEGFHPWVDREHLDHCFCCVPWDRERQNKAHYCHPEASDWRCSLLTSHWVIHVWESLFVPFQSQAFSQVARNLKQQRGLFSINMFLFALTVVHMRELSSQSIRTLPFQIGNFNFKTSLTRWCNMHTTYIIFLKKKKSK